MHFYTFWKHLWSRNLWDKRVFHVDLVCRCFFSTELFRLSVELLSDVNKSKDPKPWQQNVKLALLSMLIAWHLTLLLSKPPSHSLFALASALHLSQSHAVGGDFCKGGWHAQDPGAYCKGQETWDLQMAQFNQNHPQAKTFCGVCTTQVSFYDRCWAKAAELCHFLQEHFGVEPGVREPSFYLHHLFGRLEV